MNEVTLDVTGSTFSDVRNVQALAKEAVNTSIRSILQSKQEWPFLKTTYTQTLTAGTRLYSFPADMSKVDWDTFYIKSLNDQNTPMYMPAMSYEEYIQNHRSLDDGGDSGSGISAPLRIYKTYESKFGATPVPDNSYEVEYVYFSFPSDLITYSDTCIIPSRFDHVIVDGAMMYMMRFRSNDQSAAIHKSAFDSGIKDMQRLLLDEPEYIRSTVVANSNKSAAFTVRVS